MSYVFLIWREGQRRRATRGKRGWTRRSRYTERDEVTIFHFTMFLLFVSLQLLGQPFGERMRPRMLSTAESSDSAVVELVFVPRSSC